MPPKKPPSSAQSQKSLLSVAAAAYERKPQPLPALPDAASISPLWTPLSTPKEVFPEWPSAAVWASENWGSDETPFDDPLPPQGFLPTARPVVWKRPCEFLPPLPEPTPPPAALAPVVPDPKHAKKTAPTAKKGEPEPPKKPRPPRYAHVIYVPSSDHHAAPPTHPPPPVAAAHVDSKKTGASAAATASHPSTPAGTAPPQPPPRRILHDFRRHWSAEQDEELALWWREEERIAKEREHRERVYMEFEDAIAFIINERPRRLNEDDVKAEDLEDDGEEDEEADDPSGAAHSSPYGGFLPPAAIDIAGNAIVKPEVPHGEVVQPTFASYFRIIDQLHQQWTSSPQGSEISNTPYLWEAIYPQDAQGVPVYNSGGKYSVRLWMAGKWRRVDVDDKLPVDDEGNIQIVSSSIKNELWPSLLAKALIKVANWIGVDDSSSFVGDQATSARVQCAESVRLVSFAVTALTGWKVTRHVDAAISTGNFLSLREYIPQVKFSDSQNEMTLDLADESLPELSEQSVVTASVEDKTLKPRAVVCGTEESRIINLAHQEASLLVDIVGDPGSVSLKTVNLNGPSSLKEEDLSVNVSAFVVIHPPMRYQDQLFEAWSTDASGVAEPFKNPPAQFCVVNSTFKSGRQSASDASGESERRETEQECIDVIVTLCRIPPVSTPDGVDPEVAKHLGVDPRGSVVLVEDMDLEKYRYRLKGESARGRPPLVFKIDTSSSALLRLPRSEFESTTFRVYPQQMCRYGYSLQVESDAVKVDWQVSSTYWRNVWDLQVIEGDGAYSAMLPGSWNILFKQNIELAMPSEETTTSGVARPELHVDLHLSDADLATALHLYIVNQEGDRVGSLSGVHGSVVLPSEVGSYSLIVECRPKKLVPEGKWHLTLGSNRFFKHASIHQPRLTMFGGVYVPNKPLVCLRDVIQNPKKTTSTSIQFELLDGDLKVLSDLAASLQIIDLASGQPLAHHSAPGLVRSLQLPPYLRSADDPNEEKSGYIIQCGIDKTKCHVPAWIQSVRPFSNKPSAPPKAKMIDETGEVHEAVKEVEPPQLRWRVMCWSVDEVKLEFDRAQELRFDAIRASWAEAAKDRDAHGASSRLMFLGKHDAASTAMADESLSEEQTAKYKARAEWLRIAKNRVTGHSPHDHIDIQQAVGPDLEVVRQPEDSERDLRRFQVMQEDANAFVQTLREERVATKETRAAALKELVQSFMDQRKDAEKQRQALYTQRDEVRAQLQATHPRVGAGG